MAKLRETPCSHYEYEGECEKGREATHKKYCQVCDKYEPRAKVKHVNRKKEKLEKINKEAKDHIY